MFKRAPPEITCFLTPDVLLQVKKPPGTEDSAPADRAASPGEGPSGAPREPSPPPAAGRASSPAHDGSYTDTFESGGGGGAGAGGDTKQPPVRAEKTDESVSSITEDDKKQQPKPGACRDGVFCLVRVLLILGGVGWGPAKFRLVPPPPPRIPQDRLPHVLHSCFDKC